MNAACRTFCRACQTLFDGFSTRCGGSIGRSRLARGDRAPFQAQGGLHRSTLGKDTSEYNVLLTRSMGTFSAAAASCLSARNANKTPSACYTQLKNQPVARKDNMGTLSPSEWRTFRSLSGLWQSCGRRRGPVQRFNAARFISTTTSCSALGISTVLQGTRFEERTLAVLHNHLSMALVRVGGRADGGIDLMGDWWLPPPSESSPSSPTPFYPPVLGAVTASDNSSPKRDHPPTPSTSSTPPPTLKTDWPEDSIRRRLRIYVQCKAEVIKLGPKYVREMEGVVLALQHASRALSYDSDNSDASEDVVAVLSSESGFTRGGIERARSSSVPTVLLHLPPLNETGLESPTPGADANPSVIGGCLWNPALVRLLGPAFEVRWERSVGREAACVGRPGLWWNGRRLRSWSPSSIAGDNKEV